MAVQKGAVFSFISQWSSVSSALYISHFRSHGCGFILQAVQLWGPKVYPMVVTCTYNSYNCGCYLGHLWVTWLRRFGTPLADTSGPRAGRGRAPDAVAVALGLRGGREGLQVQVATERPELRWCQFDGHGGWIRSEVDRSRFWIFFWWCLDMFGNQHRMIQ